MLKLNSTKKHSGFTIVELLIVIVVIGVLAAISVVAYNGISQNARVSSAKALAKQVSTKVELAYTESGTYPSDLSSLGFSNSGNTTYQYSTSANSWCTTVSVGSASYYVSNTATSPVSGGCPGHGQGGVDAITNLSHSGRINSRGSLSLFNKTGVQWNGESWDAEATATVNYHGVRVYFDPSPSEVTGSYYTGAVEVGNPNSVTMVFDFDIGDASVQSYAIPPGGKMVFSTSGTRGWNNTYRFIDTGPASPSSVGMRFLVRKPTVFFGNLGSTGVYNGSSPNWVWNGTPNNSTSTGPAL